MLISLKAKILLTIFSIILLFTSFTLIYFPAQQARVLLKNYNNEIQNLANTVALAVKIAITDQNFDGVQRAMEFVKDDPQFRYIAVLQTDTAWNINHSGYRIKQSVANTFPEKQPVNPYVQTNSAILVKRAKFRTPTFSGTILMAFSTDEINQSKRKIRAITLLVSGLFLLVGSTIGLWLARNISIPVLALRDAAIRVGEGNFDQRVTTSTNDEISQLTRAFNKMVEDLNTTRKELREANNSLSATNSALNNAVEVLKSTQAQLVQTEKMASLGELTAGIAHEIQNPLNFITNFSEVNTELIQELKFEIEQGNQLEINELIDSIEQNLEKINNHGRRADAIVKGMLQHSRPATGEKLYVDLNTLTDEYSRLAFHGIRAKDKEFNAKLETDFDPAVGKIYIVPQEIGRVVLNLLNNAFYASSEKKRIIDDSFEPEVKISTKRLIGKVEIRVRDNGNGIPESVKSKVFQPFFTTKPTGQGTGLGLSISYDIITKGHGGQMEIHTKEGEYTEFVIFLPDKAVIKDQTQTTGNFGE